MTPAPSRDAATSVDHAAVLAAQRRQLADQLRAMDNAARRARVEQVCMDTGGTVTPAQTNSNWGPVFCEITMLGLYHSGDSLDETILNWIKAATRSQK
ncbi:MAG: hypothetical protein ACPG61_18985 [Paracoccaceae bacterium]